MKANQFYIKQCAENGTVRPIPYPDGSNSEDTVTILGTDSDTFRKAAREANRQRAKIAELPEDQREDAHVRASNVMLASLVKDWTLEDECTLENIVDMFENAPQFKELVDNVSTRRANFFMKPSSN